MKSYKRLKQTPNRRQRQNRQTHPPTHPPTHTHKTKTAATKTRYLNSSCILLRQIGRERRKDREVREREREREREVFTHV